MDGIAFGYKVIDSVNKSKFCNTEAETKDLLRETNILDDFLGNKLYEYLLGGGDFARSFLTSEYLYKQYDCDDCFDYTSIVSGYLKSIEQLLYAIALFSKNEGVKIKSNGRKKSNGKYPASIREKNVYKIDFIDENDGCFDTTIGSLIHFFDDNKEVLLSVDEKYKKTVIDCLDCYRIECRNDSFHLDNNYSWSKVEYIRRNTFFLYILLLTCFVLGKNDYATQEHLHLIKNKKIEKLYYMVSNGVYEGFEFCFRGEINILEPIRVRYIPVESSYPSFNKFGQITSVILTFESLEDGSKIILTRQNIPEEIWYSNINGEKELIE